MSDTPAARRAVDEAGPGPTPAGDEAGPEAGDPVAPPPWPADDEGDDDPVAEAARLLAIARQALDDGVTVPDGARLRPVKESVLRAVRPVTDVQHRVEDHTIGAVDVLVREATLQRARTTRLLTGMTTVDLAVDVVDEQVRALRDEVAALRREVEELRRAAGDATDPR
ncbi:MAG TPA: hypothetical protein VEW93_14345 [Acidimicrobiales bacterium]|nr:hypothetical protein [Acidimicrobiales bacterium]